MKYNYPRADLSLRVSSDLLDLIHEIGHELGVTVQDTGVYALLMLLDSSGVICPDWENIDPVLIDGQKMLESLYNVNRPAGPSVSDSH